MSWFLKIYYICLKFHPRWQKCKKLTSHVFTASSMFSCIILFLKTFSLMRYIYLYLFTNRRTHYVHYVLYIIYGDKFSSNTKFLKNFHKCFMNSTVQRNNKIVLNSQSRSTRSQYYLAIFNIIMRSIKAFKIYLHSHLFLSLH